MRRTFASTVIAALKTHPDLTVLLGDIGVANFEDAMADYPTRIINVGVMEQGMLSLGAGIAKAGGYPVIQTIAPFIVERGYEQLKIDFGYNQQAGLIVTVGGSFDYSKLGSTHQCPNDLMLISLIPGFNIYTPGSPSEVTMAVNKSIESRELSYVRLGVGEHKRNIEPFLGYKKIQLGSLGTLIITGTMLGTASEMLSELDLDVFYLNAFIADTSKLLISNSGPVIILEDVTEGSTAFALNKLGVRLPLNLHSIGIPVKFAPNYGTYSDLLDDFGISPAKLLHKIHSILGK